MISSLFKECINQTVDGLATSFLPGRGRPGYTRFGVMTSIGTGSVWCEWMA